ncbi:hypothetical protein Dsin_030214 [Dipteronia sinensis]|uniref:Uncharacterized protein n=1 Tax=Dipteronia sinensis TaxID=43782 RepID=A0AAE0DQV6_9ROSI|nr:hypothetical protein Dsin_030214 [Dipteronia sinensis]
MKEARVNVIEVEEVHETTTAITNRKRGILPFKADPTGENCYLYTNRSPRWVLQGSISIGPQPVLWLMPHPSSNSILDLPVLPGLYSRTVPNPARKSCHRAGSLSSVIIRKLLVATLSVLTTNLEPSEENDSSNSMIPVTWLSRSLATSACCAKSVRKAQHLLVLNYREQFGLDAMVAEIKITKPVLCLALRKAPPNQAAMLNKPGAQPQIVPSPPLRVASPPLRVASPPLRVASPPLRVASPPLRVASPPLRVASPPRSQCDRSPKLTFKADATGEYAA